MALQTLSDLYVNEIKDLYSAENQIVKALPTMIKAATHPRLRQAFTDHLEQTKQHVTRLEKICSELGVSPKGKKCHGMEGVIKEGAELISEDPEANVLDAGLAAAAQHVEHYEMAGYGSARTWAKQLGYDMHVGVLQQTLDEEGEADKLLTRIAESTLNADAEVGEEVQGGLADVAPGSKSRETASTNAQPSSRDNVRESAR